MELNKLDYYLIFTLAFDVLIIVTTIYQSWIIGQFPPSGFWTFAAVCFGGEALVAGVIKIAQSREGKNDDR